MSESNISSSASRMSAKNALLDEAKRLRVKASMLEQLAEDVEGTLSDDGEQMLWALLMNQRK